VKLQEIARQTPEPNAAATFSASEPGSSAFLRLLGQVQKVERTFTSGKFTCKTAAIEKGAVAWLELSQHL
jgi:hypothetical protein